MLTLQNIESEIDKCVATADEYAYKFQIKLEAKSCNGDPLVYIKINDQQYYHQRLQGNKTFVIDTVLDKNNTCCLIVGLEGKNNSNTMIENNKIIKDQFVKVTDIQINQLSLTNFMNYSKFVNAESGNTTHQVDGVYQNGEFLLSLKTPIFPYLSKLFQDNIQNYNVEKKFLNAQQRQELITAVYD